MTASASRTKQGKGKKHRKFGRNSRAPAMARYRGEGRAAVNKAKRAKRLAKAMKKKADRVTTPRGTARAKRRKLASMLA